jgi:hypothetical protein
MKWLKRLFIWYSDLFDVNRYREKKGKPPMMIVVKTPTYTIGEIKMLNLLAGSSLNLALVLGPDAFGNPTTLLAVPAVWSVDNSANAMITPSADGMSAVVQSVGPAQPVIVTATSGSLPPATLAFNVIAGPSTSISIAAGAPAPVVTPAPTTVTITQ